MKNRFLENFLCSIMMAVLFVPSIALAALAGFGPYGPADLILFLSSFLERVTIVAVPILGAMIVWAGFLFVTARGDVQQLAKAKQAIVWTVVGAFIILGARAVSLVLIEIAEQINMA